MTDNHSDRRAMSSRLWWLGFLAVVVAAFALRLMYLTDFAALPIFDQPVGDSAAHLRRAGEIAQGQWLPVRPFYYCSIFYPYFLALVLGLLKGNLVSVALVQLVAGTGVVAMLMLAARRVYGGAAALATGVLAALYGPSAFFEADVLGVVWGQLSLAGALLALAWWYGARARTWPVLVAGLACGFAAVERPNLLLCAIAIGVWIWVLAGAARAKAALAFVGGVAGPLAIVLALNVAGTGQWVPLTTSGGINLALAYHDGATGTYDEPWEREAPEFSAQHLEPEEAMIAWASMKSGRVLSPQEASRYWMGEAVAWIRAHPREAAMLTFRKAALMLNGIEVPNHLNFAFIRERVPSLTFLPLFFSPLIALAGVGAVVLLRRRPRAYAVLCLAVAVTALLSVVPFTVADRYRAPMLIPLFLIAGPGIIALRPYERESSASRRATTIAAAAAGVLLLAISLLHLEKPMRGRDYWMFAQAYERKGKLPEAIREYEFAVLEEPNNGQLLNNLGNAYKKAGEPARALEVLTHAARVEPGLAYPHKSLAMLYVDLKHWDEALAEFGRASAIDSTDVEVVAMSAAVYAEQGRRGLAEATFAQAKRMAPADPRLERLIRTYFP